MAEEKPAVKTTIVGGRPPGSGADIGNIPRGMEILLKKASVDPAFKSRLMEQRSDVAAEIRLELTPAEKMMVDSIPATHLESIIANTKVNSKLVPALLTGTAAVILVAMGIHAVSGCASEQERQEQQYQEQQYTQALGVQPYIEYHLLMSKGIRPDLDLPQPERPSPPVDED